MAIEKFTEVSVHCDFYDGAGRCLNNDARWDTILDAKWNLRQEGWTFGKKTLCPEHVRKATALGITDTDEEAEGLKALQRASAELWNDPEDTK